MEYYWNEDTIEYFQKQNKPGCEGEYIREIWDFCKTKLYIRRWRNIRNVGK